MRLIDFLWTPSWAVVNQVVSPSVKDFSRNRIHGLVQGAREDAPH